MKNPGMTMRVGSISQTSLWHCSFVQQPMKVCRIVVLLLLLWPCLLEAASSFVTVLDKQPDAKTNAASPVVYWHEVRRVPRPLQIHVLRVDLRGHDCKLDALVAADPDGNGPAEAELEKPLDLATRAGVVAAVNANAFAPAKKQRPDEPVRWTLHLPVDIIGWALTSNHQTSPPQPDYANFWIDGNGRGHIGNLAAPAKAQMAVAGFKELLRDGKVVAGAAKPTHPRTALGLDREGVTLWLTVVDGRQPDYSEGLTLDEVAVLMKELGCDSALNLDGGGSSVMLLATEGTKLRIINRPSDPGTRPIPVMLGIRQAAPADSRH